MNSWDVAQLTANLGDYNIKSKADVKHLERKVKRVVRHKGFDQRTLVGTTLLHMLIESVLIWPMIFSFSVQRYCAADSGQTGEIQQTGAPDMFADEQVDVCRPDGHRNRLGKPQREWVLARIIARLCPFYSRFTS